MSTTATLLHLWEAQDSTQITVATGEVVTFLDTEAERAGGWAYVSNASGQEGYVPTNYLQPVVNTRPPRPSFSVAPPPVSANQEYSAVPQEEVALKAAPAPEIAAQSAEPDMPLTIDEANTLAAAEQIANSLTGNNMNAPAAYIEPTVVNVTTTNTTTTTTTTAIATASTNSNFNSGNVYAGPGYVDQAANGPALGNDALVAIFTQCNQSLQSGQAIAIEMVGSAVAKFQQLPADTQRQVAQRCSAPISTLLLNDARIVPVFVEFVFLLIQAAAALSIGAMPSNLQRLCDLSRALSPSAQNTLRTMASLQGHAGSSVLLNMLTTADFNAQIDILPALAPIADFISKAVCPDKFTFTTLFERLYHIAPINQQLVLSLLPASHAQAMSALIQSLTPDKCADLAMAACQVHIKLKQVGAAPVTNATKTLSVPTLPAPEVAALLVLLSALTPLAQRRVLMAVFPLQYASTNPYATSCEFELCQAALAVCDISSVEELTKSIEKLNDRQVALREQATIAVAEHEQELAQQNVAPTKWQVVQSVFRAMCSCCYRAPVGRWDHDDIEIYESGALLKRFAKVVFVKDVKRSLTWFKTNYLSVRACYVFTCLYYILTLVYATLCDLFTAHILSFILNLFVLLPMSVVLWSMEAESALGQRVVMPYVVRHMPCMSHIGGRMNFIIWNAILTMSLLVAGSWQQGPSFAAAVMFLLCSTAYLVQNLLLKRQLDEFRAAHINDVEAARSVFRSADTAKTGELTATELQALFAARQTELSDRQLAYLMVQVTHIRAGGLGQTILEDEFVDLFFPRLSAAAVLPLVEVKTIPSQAMAGGAMLMAGESVVAAAEPINYNTSLPSWVRFINIFVAAWFFIGSLVGIIFSLSWINVYGLEFFTFLVNIPLLMYSFYLAAIEIRAEKFGMGAFMHRLHTDYFPFLVSKQRTGRFVTDILMAVVAIQLYQTAIVPISQPNAQYVQVFSGIVLIVGTLFNQFMDTYRAAPKFQLLFDKLRPHLQVDGSFTDDQRAERAYRAICAVANVSELNNEGLSKLVNALKVDLSQHEFELLQFHLDSNCDSTVQVQELTHWLAQYAQ